MNNHYLHSHDEGNDYYGYSLCLFSVHSASIAQVLLQPPQKSIRFGIEIP